MLYVCTNKSDLRQVDRMHSMWPSILDMISPEKVIKYVHSVQMSLRNQFFHT
jgi:hypothetical protein